VTASSAVVRIGGGLDAGAVARGKAVVAQDLARAGDAGCVAVRGSVASVIAAAAVPGVSAQIRTEAVARRAPGIAAEAAVTRAAARDGAGRHGAAPIAAAAVLGRALHVDASAAAVLLAGLAGVGASSFGADLSRRARMVASSAVRRIARNVHAAAVAGLKGRMTGDPAHPLRARGVTAGSRRTGVAAGPAIVDVVRQILTAQAARRERLVAHEGALRVQADGGASRGRAARCATAPAVVRVVRGIDAHVAAGNLRRRAASRRHRHARTAVVSDAQVRSGIAHVAVEASTVFVAAEAFEAGR